MGMIEREAYKRGGSIELLRYLRSLLADVRMENFQKWGSCYIMQ